jgi:phage terminase Nu1 subunit (DNA packaging protein)
MPTSWRRCSTAAPGTSGSWLSKASWFASRAFDAARSTRNYITELRKQAEGRGGAGVSAANATWKAAQTRLLELRVKKEEGKVIDVDDAREVWSAIVRGTRQMVLGIPGKVAFEVPTLTIHDRGVVERICRDALEDAALCRGFALRNPGGSGESEGDES